jgi:diadenosine tetraphosphate (Ap4A) HIT family hydrolase
MNPCIFCEIIAGKARASIVYEDEFCIAFMDLQPINSGHLLVVPRQHSASLADLSEETGGHLFAAAQKLASALRGSNLKCEGINFLLADGEPAGQEVFHIHLHVVPRFRGDGFGFSFSQSYHSKPDRAELDASAEQIRRAFLTS